MSQLSGFLEIDDLPREDTSAPEGIGEEASVALLAGERYAARILYPLEDRMPLEIPETDMEILRGLARGKLAAMHLLSSVFFLGVSQELRERVDPSGWAKYNGVRARMLSKRYMMDAVLHMPADIRIQLHYQHQQLPKDQLHWWHNWLNAMGTARIAEALMKEGLTIFTPESDSVAFGEVDLLAKFPNGSRGIVLQVRAGAQYDIDLMPIVEESRISRGFVRHLVETTQRIRTQSHREWIPVSARIGFSAGDPGVLSIQAHRRAELHRQITIIDTKYAVFNDAFQQLLETWV